MIEAIIFTAIIGSIVLLLFVMAGKEYSEFIEENKADFQVMFMAPASLKLIDKLKIMEKLSGRRLVSLQQKIAVLYAGKQVQHYTKMFIAQILSVVLLCLLGGGIFALLGGGDKKFLLFAIIFAAIIPYALVKKLEEKTTKRKQNIVFELPEFASKVALLVNAGETVQNAIIRCTTMKADDPNPLYIELNEAVTKLRNGESFGKVMEELSKRCGVQEVSVLTTTILLNYKRGGGELSIALRELSKELWEKRKAISKTRGEEASSKLVFPMVLVFVAVLLIIAYPALRILG
ncbi:type II secretion system F family protein [Halalkalibacter alkaliphilus]|uniref:Type II secretion system F family protein n=1 Tax=Halalkalibacter alkaliphilus TaxID=2917993 RepID=A0A9X2I4E6_9BACI|nr:type II secretion system F family protein [Halalkalibacter alkaliphilus]MCL7748011.1 type II secretion system F family protein [Halalkalibacter alkaliphilus]